MQLRRFKVKIMVLVMLRNSLSKTDWPESVIIEDDFRLLVTFELLDTDEEKELVKLESCICKPSSISGSFSTFLWDAFFSLVCTVSIGATETTG